MAFAQDAAGETRAANNQGDTIVVTASRRETNLQETPLAISAFGPSQLEDFGIDNPRDLMGRVPNLFAQRVTTSPSTQTFGMRGLGATDTISDPSVGVYIDDVYLPRNTAQLFNLPGLERIEVLRGPQGTLYGRNSTAGAIKLVTITPDNDLRINASAGYGNLNALELRGFASGPIIDDKVFASIALSRSKRDGYTFNRNTDERVNDLDQTAIMAKLRFTPTDRLEIILSGDVSTDNSTTVNYVPAPEDTPPGQVFDKGVTYESPDTRADVDAKGISLRFSYDATDDLTLKSITAYRRSKGAYPNEFDGLPAVTRTLLELDDKSFSQEFQLLGDFAWGNVTSGLFYFYEDYDVLTRNALSNLNFYFGGRGRLKTKSYAAYAQTDIYLTDKLTATLGGRFTYEERDLDAQGYGLDSDLNIVATNFSVQPDSSAEQFTPKLGLQYQWTDDVMTYVSYSQGFLAGGFSLRATSATVAQLAFGPEKVKTLEAGIRAELFDRVLTANLTGFYNWVTGKQLTVFLPEFSVGAIQNVGEAYTTGVEFETVVRPAEGLTLNGAVSYLKARITDYPNAYGCPANCQNGAGTDLVYAPDWTLSGGVTYETPISDNFTFGFSGSVEYQSRAFTRTPDPAFFEVNATAPPTTMINASTWLGMGENWEVRAEVKNLANKQYEVYNFGIPGIANGFSYTIPRTFLATVSFNY